MNPERSKHSKIVQYWVQDPPTGDPPTGDPPTVHFEYYCSFLEGYESWLACQDLQADIKHTTTIQYLAS